MRFAANAVRRQLHTLPATSPASSRTLATPETIERWSLAFLRERLTKTATRLVAHGRYAIFQMAASALPREGFAEILGLINAFRDSPAIALSACLAAREPQSTLLATRQMRLKTSKMTHQTVAATKLVALCGRGAAPTTTRRPGMHEIVSPTRVPSRDAAEIGNTDSKQAIRTPDETKSGECRFWREIAENKREHRYADNRSVFLRLFNTRRSARWIFDIWVASDPELRVSGHGRWHLGRHDSYRWIS